MPSQTFTLSAAGASTPIAVTSDMLISQYLPPGVLCFVSAGASLTYNIEVTGDRINGAGYVAATGNWFPMDSMTGLTASANAALVACVTAIRARITTYVSGTLTAQIIWAQR